MTEPLVLYLSKYIQPLIKPAPVSAVYLVFDKLYNSSEVVSGCCRNSRFDIGVFDVLEFLPHVNRMREHCRLE